MDKFNFLLPAIGLVISSINLTQLVNMGDDVKYLKKILNYDQHKK